MTAPLSFDEIERLTGFRLGIFDTRCPACGPDRKSPQNRTRPVLRLWRKTPDFASFRCARCGLEGHTKRIDRDEGSMRRATVPPRASSALLNDAAVQSEKAAALWHCRRPAAGSPVEVYLRQARGYGGPIQPTLGFLPPLKPGQHPAMIAGFGIPAEPEPGMLSVDEMNVTGVHLTLLRADGSGKAGTGRDKIAVGPSSGQPIVLHSMNDLLGLAITEGIESGLSLAEATGCGVWVAGSASRMPALAPIVPDWVDAITIAVEPDEAGEQGAAHLAMLIGRRGLHVELRVLT